MNTKTIATASLLGSFAGISAVQAHFEPNLTFTGTMLDNLSLISASFWLLPLPLVLLNLYGLAAYKRQPRSVPTNDRLIFRIVTRGLNVEAVTETINNVQQVMSFLGAPPPEYFIEVITDNPLEIHDYRVTILQVPDNYATNNGSKFKARALQYALDYSTALPSDWLIHLDEESHIDADTVYGIYQFIISQQDQLMPKIGQGAILYHRELSTNKFLTLADMVRTGDDMGRFYAQYRAGNCLFGMHGSFIVVRNDVERSIGFDFGAAGSITEDAVWALKCWQAGYKFGWVDGYVYEQSPRTIKDFLKQRRRWYVGVGKVKADKSIKWRYKWPLILSWELWGASSLLTLATLINLMHPIELPLVLRFGANLTFAGYLTVYMIGLYINLHNIGMNRFKRLYYALLQVVLLPVFSIMEASSIVYGQIKPETGFHVIKK